MELALKEAEQAYIKGEVPVGCVIVQKDKVIARGFNQIETLKDPTAHAEMISITAAAAYTGSRILEKCEMYVTLEPCAMCAGAIVLARIPLLIFGAYDNTTGACTSLYTITNDRRLNHRVHTLGGVSAEKCGAILKSFFSEKLRNK